MVFPSIMSSRIENSRERGADESNSPSDSLRILCVEDNDGDFVLVREYLKDARFEVGPEVTQARSLGDAVALMKAGNNGSSNFDVILLDLSLPDSHGPDTLNRLGGVARDAPIIILSGNEDRELAVEMVHRGAQDYLPKNALGSDLLFRSIVYALERQRAHLEMKELNQRLQIATHDLKTAQMQLIQAEKLDSLGRLAAGVAHEVKNPLATLQMGVDFFRRRMNEADENAVIMGTHMQEAITSADTIIRGMLDYSRSDALQLKLRNLNRVVRKALRMVQHQVLKNSTEVETRFSAPIPAVRIDEGKIEQVLINVMMNSLQAMADSGVESRLQLSTFWGQLETIDRDLGLRDYDRLRVQDHAVVVEIRDFGPGIPEDKMTRIFEPFFTTKPAGEGSGLGLSVAKNIIDLHRGHFQISNVENPRGLRVRIFFKAQPHQRKQDEGKKLSVAPDNPNKEEQQ